MPYSSFNIEDKGFSCYRIRSKVVTAIFVILVMRITHSYNSLWIPYYNLSKFNVVWELGYFVTKIQEADVWRELTNSTWYTSRRERAADISLMVNSKQYNQFCASMIIVRHDSIDTRLGCTELIMKYTISYNKFQDSLK